MARLETIVYECDWCKGRAPARYPGKWVEDEMPEHWKEIEHSTMCPGCQAARQTAIDDARHARLNKDRMAPPNESEGEGEKR